MIDLSLIIVSWNVTELLAECLDSVYRSLAKSALSAEIIVVDSASTDDSVTMLGTRFPEVQVLAQKDNLGFVRCNNLGLRRHVADISCCSTRTRLSSRTHLNALCRSLTHTRSLVSSALAHSTATARRSPRGAASPHCLPPFSRAPGCNPGHHGVSYSGTGLKIVPTRKTSKWIGARVPLSCCGVKCTKQSAGWTLAM